MDELTREELLQDAATKPVKHLLQLDAFTGLPGCGDSVMTFGEDGLCEMYGETYDLRRTDSIRLTIPEGYSRAVVLRALANFAAILSKPLDDHPGFLHTATCPQCGGELNKTYFDENDDPDWLTCFGCGQMGSLSALEAQK